MSLLRFTTGVPDLVKIKTCKTLFLKDDNSNVLFTEDVTEDEINTAIGLIIKILKLII